MPFPDDDDEDDFFVVEDGFADDANVDSSTSKLESMRLLLPLCELLCFVCLPLLFAASAYDIKLNNKTPTINSNNDTFNLLFFAVGKPMFI